MGESRPIGDSPKSRVRIGVLSIGLACLVAWGAEAQPEADAGAGAGADAGAEPGAGAETDRDAVLRARTLAAEEEFVLGQGAPFREDPIDLDPTEPTPEAGGAATGVVPTPEEAAIAASNSEVAAEPTEPVKRVRITGFPFVYYLPETSVGFGFGIGVSAITAAPREGSRYLWFPSNLTVGGAYTIRRQLRILITPEFYLRRGRLVIDGLTESRVYPDRFFGLGRDTDTAFQRYTDVSFRTSTAFRYQFLPGLYVGGVLDASYTRLRDVAQENSRGDPIPVSPSDQWLGTGAVPGEDGSVLLGLGATFVLDRRDFPLMTRSGYFVRVVGVGFPGGGAFTHRFFRTLLDVRGFVSFFEGKLTLAGQWFTAAVTDGAPFNYLASVGGPIGLRSYPDGRFRDNAHTYAQAELRFPIVWRFRGAFHVGTGGVFGQASRGRAFEPLWAVGLGVRLVVFEDRRLAVRGDLVLGPEGLRVMAFVHEAF